MRIDSQTTFWSGQRGARLAPRTCGLRQGNDPAIIAASISAGSIKYFDVAVIGARPAGCSAALALAGNGINVGLLEKSALPRYKTCGGGVLARAFQRLPPEAGPAVERSFDFVALNFLGTDMCLITTRAEPIVRITMRADLDNRLARAAEKAERSSSPPVR